MDAAVGLVEAYLYANGYFTVTEYPIVEALEDGGYRSLTDIDVLAVRLPGAGRIVVRERGHAAHEPRFIDPDPLLVDERSDDWIDLLIGEVKEGQAELNRGARQVKTLIAALRRFAFLEPPVAQRLADHLVRRGEATIDDRRVRIRLVAFGSRPGDTRGHRVILLRQCIDFLVRSGREYADVVSVSQSKNQTLNLIALLGKSGFLGRQWVRRQPDGDDDR